MNLSDRSRSRRAYHYFEHPHPIGRPVTAWDIAAIEREATYQVQFAPRIQDGFAQQVYEQLYRHICTAVEAGRARIEEDGRILWWHGAECRYVPGDAEYHEYLRGLLSAPRISTEEVMGWLSATNQARR